ncbi:MAG: NAD(P)/FAD-dependent oxidoreductase [Dehalococcoidales bacterium]|nr:MAG: NAD(P)/FAD-dependent oxidoreductase [Dehalococcoidales bacterium]
MEKSIIIIGAGIAGLSAGCYGQMNGYNTQIFEMDTRPGGLCTSWKRKGYTIDGCLHWLLGSGPASSFYKIWEELGVIKNHTFIDHDEYISVEVGDGKSLVLCADLDKTKQNMKEVAPEDTEVIEDWIKGLKKLIGFDMSVDKAPELANIFDTIRMMFKLLPYLWFMRKWGRMSVKQFAERLKSAHLREAFLGGAGDMKDFTILGLMMSLVWVNQKIAGYPLGGSLALSKTIEKRYLDLGGKVSYKSPVKKVLVKNDKAVGIRLADGSEHHADIIISAADGHTTIFDMLEGKYINNKIKGYYDNNLIFPPLLHVAYGVSRTFNEAPKSVGGFNLMIDKPIIIAGKEHNRLPLYIYNFDPSLAPDGKTVLKFIITTRYEPWEELYKDTEAYKAEKERLAGELLTVLEERFPGITEQVEMTDVATPMTWVRYTGNWKGSYEGWIMTSFGMRMKKTLPGLDGFYMVGQWVEPGGGLPGVAPSGRNVIQIICKKDKKKFVTSTP